MSVRKFAKASSVIRAGVVIAVCVPAASLSGQDVTGVPGRAFAFTMSAPTAVLRGNMDGPKPGDVVETVTGKIGDHEIKAEKIVDKVEGDKISYKAQIVDGTDLKPAEITIQTACLRSFFLARVIDPEKISFGCYGGWGANVGMQSEAGVKDYLGGFRTGGLTSLTLNNDEAGLYSELASDNLFLSARAGFARIGFGALANANKKKDDTTPAASDEKNGTANQFYQGGGNASMYVAFPALYWRNFIQPFQGTVPQFIRRADLFFAVITSADIPDMGSAVQDFGGNIRAGFQGTVTQSTMAQTFNLYVNFDASAGLGTKTFFKNLKVNEDQSAFLVGQLGLGVDINHVVRIGVETGRSTMGANLKPRLSIKLIPN